MKYLLKTKLFNNKYLILLKMNVDLISSILIDVLI